MSGTEGDILFRREGDLGLVTLNRPEALNALTHGMCLALSERLRAWAADDAVAAVLIEGAGERAFCAGGDIRKLYDEGRTGGDYPQRFYRDEYRLNALIHYYPKPFISLLDGIVMGGGCGVSIPGSHRVASGNILFAMPETGIGLFPDVGGSFFLSRAPGHVGLWLALTGARLKSADCLYAGVADHHVPTGAMPALIDALAALGAQGGNAFEAVTALIRGFAEAPGASELAARRAQIDRHFSQPSVAAILASLAAADDEWAAAQAGLIRAKSPTALKIALTQVREGAGRDFRACMQMEWRMVNRVIAGHDFYEGVRAAVIDKDRRPVWRPAALAEVTEADTAAHFAPLPDGELTFD